jgi:predicted ATPase
MLRQNLVQVWNQLQGRKPHLSYFLDDVRICGFRGIKDLRVRFTYPVSVIAGQNACGKSTVLFALACAYSVPNAGIRDFVPSTIFPDFISEGIGFEADHRSAVTLDYHYYHGGEHHQMRWSRKKGWSRSYFGAKNAKQPERNVYIRTVASLSNPSEVRGFLSLRRKELRREEITADLLNFAHQVLPGPRYSHILSFSDGKRDILYANREDGLSYSEFHMSAGERAVLRLSKDISELRDSLVLIDEVEAGLHPLTQQQLMLQLQRLALRTGNQIVVTTHSPAVIETVPDEARIFLERTNDNVILQQPHRDIIQKALYGQSNDKLSILCEDDVAEGLIRGVMDVLNPKLSLSPADIVVGRDTGKDEFPRYVKLLSMFGQLDGFVFVLDGDGLNAAAKVRQAAMDEGQSVQLLMLPGKTSPEEWIWGRVRDRVDLYASRFGVSMDTMESTLVNIEREYESAADTARNKSKGRLYALSLFLHRKAEDISRSVGSSESTDKASDINGFVTDLESCILNWRNLGRQAF